MLLTGATSGIGAAAAARLAPRTDRLLLHGPEPEDAVRDRLGAGVEYLQADYGELRNVGALIAAVRERIDRLDLLINNAARPGPPARTLSADGHEVTWQTNYLALVALTGGLLPVLEGGRIVNVASATHYSATLELDDLELTRGYSGPAAYAHSKLAIVTYTCWLARQPRGTEAVSIHPGVIATGLLHAMFSVGGDTVDHGADNLVAVASLDGNVNGAYFDETRRAEPNPEALDERNQERLMAATTEALSAAGLS